MNSTKTNNKDKNNAFKLSEQVKLILHEKGYSFLFNYNDYKLFKAQVKNAFNIALAIAEKFIAYHEPQENDFSIYEY